MYMVENVIRINNELVKAEIKGSNEVIFKIANAISKALDEIKKDGETQHDL